MAEQPTEPAPAAEVAPEEVSREQAFLKLWENEAFHDVAIKGTDGLCVGANRCALAARSDVLERMLFGRFSESSSKEIEIGYRGKVLKAVLEYIHTDSAAILAIFDNDDNKFEDITTLVELVEAASYLNLPCLGKKATDCLMSSLQKFPSLSLAILQACYLRGPSAPKLVEKIATFTLRSNWVRTDDIRGVERLNPRVLAYILIDRKTWMDECNLFRLLQRWAEAPVDATRKVNRKALAIKMAKKCLQLEKIAPDDLSEVVGTSGLVSEEQLSEAYKKQALAAQNNDSPVFKKPRRTVVWRESHSERFIRTPSIKVDVLNVPPIWAGKYKWTIEMEKVPAPFLGVIWVADDQGTWWGSAGTGRRFLGVTTSANAVNRLRTVDQLLNQSRNLSLELHNGSKIWFELDLSADNEDNGSLSVGVDESAPEKIGTDLRARCGADTRNYMARGFFPALTTSDTAQGPVRLLDFQKL